MLRKIRNKDATQNFNERWKINRNPSILSSDQKKSKTINGNNTKR